MITPYELIKARQALTEQEFSKHGTVYPILWGGYEHATLNSERNV